MYSFIGYSSPYIKRCVELQTREELIRNVIFVRLCSLNIRMCSRVVLSLYIGIGNNTCVWRVDFLEGLAHKLVSSSIHASFQRGKKLVQIDQAAISLVEEVEDDLSLAVNHIYTQITDDLSELR